uniref:Uncharacterized protein n=1 Tax=Ananas comosus var. bracteatus TaxID=296719 RepID=A0A6V7NWK7_ANACO|nr:unnamed protein product [Ananas comosus var. bracteatus]
MTRFDFVRCILTLIRAPPHPHEGLPTPHQHPPSSITIPATTQILASPPSAAGHTPHSSSATASLRRGSFTTQLCRAYDPSISNAESPPPPPPPPKRVTCARALESRRFMCRFTE